MKFEINNLLFNPSFTRLLLLLNVKKLIGIFYIIRVTEVLQKGNIKTIASEVLCLFPVKNIYNYL